jgi:hypothetical protein
VKDEFPLAATEVRQAFCLPTMIAAIHGRQECLPHNG